MPSSLSPWEDVGITTHASSGGAPVVVAIVDDGVRISHEDLRTLMWQRPKEIPGNRIDDDANGHVDDVNGWDVADGNASVVPPAARTPDFYHGTQVAGIVAAVARRVYGDDAPEAIRLLAVKALSDTAERSAIEAGFDGIAYAVGAGADVVVCAWGVNTLTSEERAILDDAVAKGVLIVASAGNFGADTPQYPAAHPGVLSVAALDAQGQRLATSNFGSDVDLAAPGYDVDTAGVASDAARTTLNGTSAAASLVGGALAALSHAHPTWSNDALVAALLNTATPLAVHDPRFAAGLGAGRLDLAAAMAHDPWATSPLWRRASGMVPLAHRAGQPWGVAITPPGELHGIHLSLGALEGAATGRRAPRLAVYAGRSTADDLVWEGLLADAPDDVFVPGSRAYVRVVPGSRRPFRAMLRYRAEAVDLSTRYCSGTVQVTEPGPLSDGSGGSTYAPGTDCRWVITAPEGQVPRVSFDAFDTEARTDWLYFFHGPTAAGQIQAVYSGPDVPPDVVGWSPQLHVWFVANGEVQGQGWRASVTFEPMPDTPVVPALPSP